MEEFLMKPKVDVVFKEIMEDVKARTGFLSAVLQIRPQNIKETSILDANLRKLREDDKHSIFDIKLLLNDNSEVDVRIHISQWEVPAEHSVYYLSKLYTGQGYNASKKCINIDILDCELFPEQKEFYSCFCFREDTRGFIYNDKMEFHLIELPKLPKEIREDSSDIELWAKFINAERKEEFDILAQKNQYIESAYERLQVISQDKEKRQWYEAREKAILNHSQMILEAEERGEKRGKERMSKLFAILVQEKRFEDLERAARDEDFLQQLILQYDI